MVSVMSKLASQQDRRIEVSDAAWRVILREGLDRTSMRAIAQELGATTGVVTHYFRDKDELMLFALDRLITKTITNMKASIEGYEGLERLERMLLTPLPLQPGDEAEWKIWIAFLGCAIGREALMVEHRRRYADLHNLVLKELQVLQAAQWIRADLDLNLEANALVALIDGIGTSFVIDSAQLSPDEQRYLVRRYVDGLRRK
jgi:AcrR family transcriptional regulator